VNWQGEWGQRDEFLVLIQKDVGVFYVNKHRGDSSHDAV